MSSSTVQELITFATTADSGVETIGGVLSAYQIDLETAVDTSEITYGALPLDSFLATSDEYQYLLSRPSKQVEVLKNHISLDGGGVPFSGTGTAVATAEFKGAAETFSQDSDAWVARTVDTEKKTFKCATGVLDVTGGAKACGYDGNLLITDAQVDEFDLQGAGLTLAAVATAATAEVNPLTILNQDISTVSTLLLTHPFADLSAVTSGEWLTAFLPNANAIASLDNAVPGASAFVTWNKAVAQAVLKNHVLPSSTTPAWSEDVVGLVDKAAIATLGADKISVKTGPVFEIEGDASTLTVGLAQGDVYTKNGVVHIVDNVILSGAQVSLVSDATARTSLASALDATNFKTLLDLVPKADDAVGVVLGETATTQQTLFAPTEEAFAALNEEQLTYLTSAEGKDDLTKVLKAHVVSTAYFTNVQGSDGNGLGEQALTDLNGDMLKCDGTTCTGGAGNAEVKLTAETYTKYGVVHTIDAVIIPSGTNIPAADAGSASTLIVGGALGLLSLGVSMLF